MTPDRKKRASSRAGHVSRKRHRTLEVWDYVEEETDEEGNVFIKCVKCATQFSTKTSTGITKSRIKVHGNLLDQYDQKRFTNEGM